MLFFNPTLKEIPLKRHNISDHTQVNVFFKNINSILANRLRVQALILKPLLAKH